MAEPAAGGRTSARGALAALAGASAAALAAYWASDSRYQAFIDKYPIDRFMFGELVPYGPTLATREPLLLHRFDWCIHWWPDSDRLRTTEPRSVVVFSDQLLRLRHQYGVLLETSGKERLLMIWGDRLLSTFANEARNGWQDDVRWLFSQFSRIACQAKDFPALDVGTAPMGLTEAYLRGGNWKAAKSAIAAASLQRKRRNVLASPGLNLPAHLLGASSLPESYAPVVASRETSKEWASSPAARDLGVDFRAVSASRWWSELSTYRFLISPHGLAVQSTKTVEALLVLTVPIVQRATAHEDLAKMGFPLLIVDAWDNITRRALDAAWASLSPRLPSFRSSCLTAESYWKIFVGQLSSCY